MTLKIKIIGGYLAILSAMVFITILAIRNYTEVIGFYEEINTKDFELTRIGHELTYRMLERRSGLQGFLLTGKTRYLISYDENIQPINGLLRKARDIYSGDEEYSRLIDRYEILINDWEKNIGETEKHLRQQLDYGLDDYPHYVASIAEIDKKDRSIFRELKMVEAQFLNATQARTARKSETATVVGVATKKFLILVAVASIILSFIMSTLLWYHVTSALDRLVRAARAISRGYLSYRIPKGPTDDELEALTGSFNEMAERLEEKIHALRESEEKYSTLVECANDGIAIIQNRQFVFANKKLSEMIGYGADEINGMDYLAIVPIDDAQAFRERYYGRLKGEDVPHVIEGQFICKNGDIKCLEVNVGLIDYRNEKAFLTIYRDITDRKMYQENLKRHSDQLITMQEEERKRISHELHDEIGQALSAMNINIEILEKGLEDRPDARQQRLDDVKGLISRTIDNIHRISYNLRPYLLDNFGLISALRWYTDTFRERTGIGVSLQIEGTWQEIDPALETVLFRITQEALTNVLKHAEATTASIVLSRYPVMIEMSIKDDGEGFNMDDYKVHHSQPFAEGGLGLFGIKERLAVFEGTFTIESVAGAGTTLLIKVPLSPA
jgi:PAS domain S-box-containing protein